MTVILYIFSEQFHSFSFYFSEIVLIYKCSDIRTIFFPRNVSNAEKNLGPLMYMHYRMTAGMFELGSFPNGRTIGSPISVTRESLKSFLRLQIG